MPQGLQGFQKGNKGFRTKESYRKAGLKISKSLTGKKLTKEHRKKMSLSKLGRFRGENSPSWKNGIRKNSKGYILIYMPEHPYCDATKCIRIHRYICECYLGRFLHPDETPHHINEIKDDNLPENLHLFNTSAEHTHYHLLVKSGKIPPITTSNLPISDCSV